MSCYLVFKRLANNKTLVLVRIGVKNTLKSTLQRLDQFQLKQVILPVGFEICETKDQL